MNCTFSIVVRGFSRRCFSGGARSSVPESVASLSQLISADDPGLESLVLSCAGGLAKASGLDGAAIGRAVNFSGGAHGVVLHFDEKTTTAGIMSRGAAPRVSEEVVLHGALSLKTPDAASEIKREVFAVSDLLTCHEKSPSIFSLPRPPLIKNRRPVSERLASGILVLETLQPVAQGQRIGFVGPPGTGKSYVAQALAASQPAGTACVYAAVAERNDLDRKLSKTDSICSISSAPAARQFVIHADPAQDPPSALYLLPLAALHLAKNLLLQYKHVLLVLDDLSIIADATADLGNQAFARTKMAPPLGVPHIVAAALEGGGVFVDSEGEERSLTVAAVVDMPPDAPPYSLRDLWIGAEPSLDVSFSFDGTLAAHGHLPGIDQSDLTLHKSALPHQLPMLRFLRSALTASLTEGKERQERMELARELGLHDENEDEHELIGHDRVVKALLAQRQIFSLPEIAVVLHAACVYYFVGKSPTADAIVRFQSDIICMVREEQPDLWGLLERMEELDDATAERVLETLAEVLVHNRYRFHLTQPEI